MEAWGTPVVVGFAEEEDLPILAKNIFLLGNK